MNSCLYIGKLRHRRFHPISHQFSYRVLYYFLDLDELDTLLTNKSNKLFKDSWFYPSLDSNNYPAERSKLKDAIISLLNEKLDKTHNGKIFMLTQLKVCGYCFNPLTLYYHFDSNNELTAILAEVSNTPWNEKYFYALDCADSASFQHDKMFHVSPLLPMDMRYQWQITVPGKELKVHINDIKDNEKWFDATLNLTRQNFSGNQFKKWLFKFPLMTYKIIILIHWQALILKLKGATYYPYPKKK